MTHQAGVYDAEEQALHRKLMRLFWKDLLQVLTDIEGSLKDIDGSIIDK